MEKIIQYFLKFKKKIKNKNKDTLLIPLIEETRLFFHNWESEFDLSSKQLEYMIHPIWGETQPKIKKIIFDDEQIMKFLSLKTIQFMFFRMGFSKHEIYELKYLKNSPTKMWNLIKEYEESPIGAPILDCKELNISSNSLAMLYYWKKIATKWDITQINSIIEVGGGYGSFCRVMHELASTDITYILFDLPEMLTLQYFFLSASSKGYNIIVHTSSNTPIVSGKINLIPIYWLEEYNVGKCDLFVSHFALSETPFFVQKLVSKKILANCKYLCITSQITDSKEWKDVKLSPHEDLLKLIENNFIKHNVYDSHYDNSIEVFAEK